jgi:uncharacterized protein YuzE
VSNDVYLEVSFRHGKPLAGYLHLPRREGEWASRSRKAAEGLVVDYAQDGQPIGIEIVSPSIVTVEAVNRVLTDLKQQAVEPEELAPLRAGR